MPLFKTADEFNDWLQTPCPEEATAGEAALAIPAGDWDAIVRSVAQMSIELTEAKRKIAEYQEQVEYLALELDRRECEAAEMRARRRAQGRQ